MSLIKKLFYDTVYTVGYRTIKKDGIKYKKEPPFNVIEMKKKYWIADPFIFSYNDAIWLFVEKMNRWEHKGIISAAPLINGKIGEFKDVLIEEFHLSYPMIFEKDGTIYMIPETADTKSIRLYKCEEFPNKWKYEKTLLSGALYVDTNVFELNGKWYLITSEMDKNIGAKTKVLYYQVEDLENGIIVSMPQNKYTDFSFECRGAGGIFFKDGMIIRPTQCGDNLHYGTSLRLNKIEIKNGKFVESLLSRIEPNNINLDKNITVTGTHTYGINEMIELIDIKYSVVANPILQLKKIIRKVKSKNYHHE